MSSLFQGQAPPPDPGMGGDLVGGTPQPVPGGLGDMLTQPPPPPQAADPLETLQDVIEAFPGLLVALHDPADVDAAAGALKTLTGIQRRLMSEASGSPSATGR